MSNRDTQHNNMKPYMDLLHQIYYQGEVKSDRTGTGTYSMFGAQMEFDLREGFPLLQKKFVPFDMIFTELSWMMQGLTNVNWLQQKGCHIWDEWAGPDGGLGPIYGAQWRSIQGPDGTNIDQLAKAQELLLNDPDSRRIIVNAWNVAELDQMALTPCHAMFQFWTRKLSLNERIEAAPIPEYQRNAWLSGIPAAALQEKLDLLCVPRRGLSCKLYQRSADMFLGVPFNIASYALLTHLMAATVGMKPEMFIWSGGDCHLYSNHRDQAKELMDRPSVIGNPHLFVTRAREFVADYKRDDFELIGYKPAGKISAPVAV